MTEERKKDKGAGRVTGIMMASLALNCFLVGLVIGPMVGQAGPRDFERKPPNAPPFMFERVVRDLSPDEAVKVRAIFDDERRDFRDKQKDMHEVMQALAQILKTEKPDVAALRRVLDEVHLSGQTLHKGMGRMFERLASELSLESRRKIAEAIERGGDHPMPPPPEMGERP